MLPLRSQSSRGMLRGRAAGASRARRAQAEGAIEGTWEDYIVPTPFATDYKFSRFDAKAAPHRDVSKLSGSKKAAVADAAGASDSDATAPASSGAERAAA